MTKQDLSKAPEGYSQINWDNMTDKDKKVILRVKKRSSSLTPRAEGRAAEENVGREGTQPTNNLYDPTAPSLDSYPPAQPEQQYQTSEQQAETVNPLDAGEAAVQQSGGHIQEIGNENEREENLQPYIPSKPILANKVGETQFIDGNFDDEETLNGFTSDEDRIMFLRTIIDGRIKIGKVLGDRVEEKYSKAQIPSVKLGEIVNDARNHAVAYVLDNPSEIKNIANITRGFGEEMLEDFMKFEYTDENATQRLPVQKSRKSRGGLVGLIAGMAVAAVVGGILGYNIENKKSEKQNPKELENQVATYSNNDKVSNTGKPSMFVEMPENFQKTPDPRENQTTFEYTEENKNPSEAPVPVISYTVKPGNDGNVENAPLEEPEIVKENPVAPKVDDPAENFGKEPFAYSTTQEELEERLSKEERELTDVEQARRNMAEDAFNSSNTYSGTNLNPTNYDFVLPKPVEAVTSANWYAFAQGGVKVPIFNRKGEESPNPTWVVEAGVGRKFATGLSLEVKAGHSEYTDTKTEAGNYASIEEVENSVGLGFLYNQPISEDWTFKIGTGVGATFRDTDVEFGNSSIPTIQVHDSEVVPYIELNTGLEYNITRNFSVNVNLSGRTSPEDNAGVTGTATLGGTIYFGN